MALGATLVPYTAKSVRRQSAAPVASRSSSGMITALVFLVFLLIASSIFYIATHVKVVNLGYKINHEIQLKETIIEENKRLSLEIARLQSLTRIESEAISQLGLKLPDARQIVYLNRWDDSVLAKFAPAKLPATTLSAEKSKAGAKMNEPAPANAKNTPKAPAMAKQVPVPAAEKMSPSVKSGAAPAPVAVASNKAPHPAVAKDKPRGPKPQSVGAKKTSGVIVATLVSNRPEKAAAVPSQNAGAKISEPRKRDKVPAVLLDPIP